MMFQQWQQILKNQQTINAIVSINPKLKMLEQQEHAGILAHVAVALKDCFLTPNWPSSCGAKHLLEYENCVHSSEVVELLEKQGAIIVCKANVPIFNFDIQTFNDIYGTTNNPYNVEYTVGGSSGACAALVAMQLVPLAVGSDVAGSLRIPASFCGVWSCRPSWNRVPTKGHVCNNG